MKFYDFDDIGIWYEDPCNIHSRRLGLDVTGTPIGDPSQRVRICIPWRSLVPFKNEIQRGLHDDIAGALRERLVEIIKGALKEVEQA